MEKTYIAKLAAD
jgi:cobalamin-dependent methionine synthase I